MSLLFKNIYWKIKRIISTMNKNDVYIWYSPATDVTGKNLQEALGISGGKTKPPANKKLVIGWGTKNKEDVIFPKTVKVLNHPNQIRLNRNKLEASGKLAAALNINGVRKVARMALADQVKQALADGAITMPLIGRTKYHQGGKGFWECPTVAQLDNALEDGAQYFQEMIAVQDEYRLHVFEDKIIHAVKKVKRTDEEFETAWVEDELNRQKDLWTKNNTGEFNENQAKTMLTRQAKSACAGGANMVLRSNKLGWKFKIVKKWDASLTELAVAAVKALGMNFGAVDCCVDTAGNPYVFEVNSGPGLEGTSFDMYVAAFNKVITGKTAKILEESPVTVTKATASIVTRKQLLAEQLQRLTEMVKEATEEEVDMVQRLGARIIFGTTDDNGE